jgi:hypothetical protein
LSLRKKECRLRKHKLCVKEPGVDSLCLLIICKVPSILHMVCYSILLTILVSMFRHILQIHKKASILIKFPLLIVLELRQGLKCTYVQSHSFTHISTCLHQDCRLYTSYWRRATYIKLEILLSIPC